MGTLMNVDFKFKFFAFDTFKGQKIYYFFLFWIVWQKFVFLPATSTYGEIKFPRLPNNFSKSVSRWMRLLKKIKNCSRLKADKSLRRDATGLPIHTSWSVHQIRAQMHAVCIITVLLLVILQRGCALTRKRATSWCSWVAVIVTCDHNISISLRSNSSWEGAHTSHTLLLYIRSARVKSGRDEYQQARCSSERRWIRIFYLLLEWHRQIKLYATWNWNFD